MLVVPRSFESRRGIFRCWGMLSHGLQKWGQKEIILFAALQDDDLARGVNQVTPLLRSIHQHAMEGKSFDIGGHSQFTFCAPGLFGRPDFKALLYTRPYNLLTPELDAATLLAVVVTAEEFEVALHCGHTRVLARLGDYYRFFPTAPWCDPDRPQLLSQAEVQSSLVFKTASMPAYECSTWMAGQRREKMAPHGSPTDRDLVDRMGTWQDSDVHLVMPKSFRPRLADALRDLPDDAVFTLLTGILPSIERCFVWPPDEECGKAIGINDSRDRRVAGNFITFVPDQPQSSSRVFEDGFAVQVTGEDWRRLKVAMMDGKRLTITGDTGEAVVHISWL